MFVNRCTLCDEAIIPRDRIIEIEKEIDDGCNMVTRTIIQIFCCNSVLREIENT